MRIQSKLPVIILIMTITSTFFDFVFAAEFSDLKNIRIKGVMGMASNTADEQQIEKEFENLKTVFESIKLVVKDCDTISAGMSGDYQLAMQHGSTMVRIGSSIFGSRVYV